MTSVLARHNLKDSLNREFQLHLTQYHWGEYFEEVDCRELMYQNTPKSMILGSSLSSESCRTERVVEGQIVKEFCVISSLRMIS